MTATARKPRLVIIGCGPHYRTRYDRLVRDRVGSGRLEVAAVVDLASRKDSVLGFAQECGLEPDRFIFLDEQLRDPPSLEVLNASLVEARLDELHPSMMLISSEPKSHRAYARWALSRGLDIFSDKPATVPHPGDPGHGFESAMRELLAEQARAGVRYVVSCERRMNQGYRHAFAVLREIMAQHRVPVTSVAVQFAGGVWNTPHEYETRENHPYKYGYGVSLHSGYHYVDLLARLLELNASVIACDRAPSSVDVLTRSPAAIAGFHPQLPGYRGHPDPSPSIAGEIDMLVHGKVRGERGFEAIFSLEMTDISVSQRTHAATMDNPYVEGGRVRQEHVSVHLGHLCSLRIASDSLPPRDPGMSENFSVTVARNSALIGGASWEEESRHSLGERFGLANDAYLNIEARLAQFSDFLDGGDGNSPLESHLATAMYLDTIWACLPR